MSTRITEARRAQGRGWALTPLRGKRPILKDWPNRPSPRLEEVLEWARAGSVGLRTGSISGVVVIDVDAAKGGSVSHLHLPATVTVITGSGGQHLYFRHPGKTLRNSVGRLAPHVDVRADGGLVVFVGSVHPSTGRVYRWAEGASPDDLDIAEMPEAVLRILTDAPPRDSAYSANIANRIIDSISVSGSTPYGQAALSNESLSLQSAPYGTRNDRLNRSAFRLGRLVARGHLLEQEVVLRLSWAAEACGLPAHEARRTIQSGLAAGLREQGR